MISERLKRCSALIRKRSKFLRDILPYRVVKAIKSGENKITKKLKKMREIKNECKYENIYHVALQKTGTQWMFDVLSDPIVYEHSGMTVEKFDVPRRKSQSHPIRSLEKPYEKNTIITPFAGTYENYVNDVPKDDRRVAIFHVIRDPREMVVSWYFSTRDNHMVDKVSMLNAHRKNLKKKSKKEGLKYVIDLFDWKGKFEVMRSWMNKREDDKIKIIKFEDLTEKSLFCFRDLFNFLDIRIPEDRLEDLVKSYSFETLTGREKGEEDQSSHMRSGKSSTWRHHFDDELKDIFYNKAHDIVGGYGYEI